MKRRGADWKRLQTAKSPTKSSARSWSTTIIQYRKEPTYAERGKKRGHGTGQNRPNQTAQTKPPMFTKRIGSTVYRVSVHFNDTSTEILEELRHSGVFILVSKLHVDNVKILPPYYSRQAVEQAFDFGKNYANLLPLRTQNEDTFRGHLLVSFMATVSIMVVDKLFVAANPRAKSKKPLNFIQAGSCLRQMKYQVYDEYIAVSEPDRKSNDVLRTLKVDYVRAIWR